MRLLHNIAKHLSKDELKKLAPLIYHYLDSIDDELGGGSRFNKKGYKALMKTMVFYGWKLCLV
ncbi:hypothetical protein ACSIDX_000593 [Campylobacter lari]